MKFLFQNNRIGFSIAWLAMMFKICFYHLIGYVARTPNTISNCPKMPAPISLGKGWVFFLQPARGSALQPLNYITYVQQVAVLYVYVHMFLANNSFQYFNILCVTNLLNKFPTSLLDIAFQNFISIFCNPNYVGSKPRHSMAANSLIFTHKVKLPICVATESLALKAHSFN